MARLKSCPDTNAKPHGPELFMARLKLCPDTNAKPHGPELFMARLKSCPDTNAKSLMQMKRPALGGLLVGNSGGRNFCFCSYYQNTKLAE
jgi:hypothetical protein